MEGISFIVRVRDEEATLEQSLRSLNALTVPHEIHVILHMCTDRSREIAELLQAEGMPIHIHTYDHPVSRAGYETLITDKTSPHSLVHYYDWCYNRATRAWLFKWDADFEMTPRLTDFLNARTWTDTGRHSRYYIPAINEDSNNGEHYLFTRPYAVEKYIFWEITYPVGEHDDLTTDGAHLVHLSTLNVKKQYWNQSPWFMDDTSEEASVLRARYAAVLSICGPDIPGAARAANPECCNYQWAVTSNEDALKAYGISFWF